MREKWITNVRVMICESETLIVSNLILFEDRGDGTSCCWANDTICVVVRKDWNETNWCFRGLLGHKKGYLWVALRCKPITYCVSVHMCVGVFGFGLVVVLILTLIVYNMCWKTIQICNFKSLGYCLDFKNDILISRMLFRITYIFCKVEICSLF